MTGLIGWWPLHENSGSTAYDLSGNGNHGSLSGGVTTGVAGKGGLTGYSFDGGSGFVNWSDGGHVESKAPPVSISLWAYFPSGSQGPYSLFSQQDDGGNTVLVMLGDRAGEDKVKFSIYDDNDTWVDLPGGNIEEGWMHITAVWKPDQTMQIFVDGKKKGEASTTAGTVDTSDPIGEQVLGIYDYGGSNEAYFNGKISDVRIYNRVLSSVEVQQLYEWGNGDYARPVDSSDSSAVSRWSFDGDTTDSWGSNDGTDNTSAGFVSGVRGQAKAFDGSDDYVVLQSSSGVDGKGGHTISSWVNLNSVDEEDIFGKWGSDSSNKSYLLMVYDPGSGPNVRGHVHDGANSYVVDAGDAVKTNGWYHVAQVWDGKKLYVYTNGRMSNSISADISLASSSKDPHIGHRGYNASSHLDGSIDEIRFYNRALSPSEVFELYRWGTGGRDLRKFTVNSR
ncbi:LamG domain-containing protein [Candidatus Nanosalina sp. VS9-1]|uniref:LamG domain-containing protein n=1 Tax=Candidatus Nanosalina sp. VS9-1 TaxID=3388566 RepID=UPI0039E087B4